MQTITCFKAYDVRGRLLEQIDEQVAFAIGVATARVLNAKSIVLGSDVRHTSLPLKLALAAGLVSEGCDVIDIGAAGTEEVYFATPHFNADGGIEVTASHNPIDYNGLKFVGKGAVPISSDSGLGDIRKVAEQVSEQQWLDALRRFGARDERVSDEEFLTGAASFSFAKLLETSCYRQQTCMNDYLLKLLSFVDYKSLKPLTLVVNSGNGAAGKVIDALDRLFQYEQVPIQFIRIQHQPDGDFPNGIPNPLLPDNRSATRDAVIEHGADFGIAWDGDFDRCFLFDEQGEFIEGYYIVGLLATAFLHQQPHQKIIYDPRVYWNTEALIEENKGKGVKSKTGHAFIKERMRKEDAVYGGEMSAHHYFRDFYYCDSGMIPWLLVAELITKANQPLSSLVNERIAAFPSSGEINSTLKDANAALRAVEDNFTAGALIERLDGIDVSFPEWRFSLRKSNTEPVIRLNVEARGNRELVEEKTQVLLDLIRQH